MQARLSSNVDFSDVAHVMEHITHEDCKEVMAVRMGRYNAIETASHLYDASGFLCKMEAGGVPCAVGGAVSVWPGYGSMWMFTTPVFQNVLSLSVLKGVKKVMLNAFRSRNIHRAEARCMESHKLSSRWIEFMGGKLDCRLPQFGIHKEDFLQYSWIM
mgnify:CR=1 FL=1